MQNRTQVVGSELLATLLKRVRFEGATGLVEFFDASADADRMYDGDRRSGVSYTVLNYVDVAHGLVTVGSWMPCAAAGCSWSERWGPTAGVGLTYSTADNSKPPQTAPARVTEVRLGVLLAMLGTEDAAHNPI